MRKSGIFLWILTIAAGAAGAVMRSIERDTVFDGLTGLALKNAPISLALIGLSVIFAAAALFLSFRQRGGTEPGYMGAFGHHSIIACGLTAISGAAICVAAIFEQRRVVAEDGHGLAIYIWTALGVAAGLALIIMAVRSYNGNNGRGDVALLSIVPVVFLCWWLISDYMTKASNPVILDYIYEVFAIGFGILGFYYAAGFAFGKSKPRKMVFCSQMAVYFCFITAMDGHSRAVSIIFAAIGASLLLSSAALILNLRSSPAEPDTE